jgi:hypothetical protein
MLNCMVMVERDGRDYRDSLMQRAIVQKDENVRARGEKRGRREKCIQCET